MPPPTQVQLAYQVPFTRLDPDLQRVLLAAMQVDSGEPQKLGMKLAAVGGDVTTQVPAYGFRRVLTYDLLPLFFANFPDAAVSGPVATAACSNLYTRVLQQKLPTDCVGEIPVFV